MKQFFGQKNILKITKADFRILQTASLFLQPQIKLGNGEVGEWLKPVVC